MAMTANPMRAAFGAEEALLGAIFLRPEIVGDVIAELGRDSAVFEREDHAAIFGAILSVRDSGAALDVVVVGNRLREMNPRIFEASGGKAYLASFTSLVHVAPLSANWSHYVAIILDNCAVE